MDLSSTAEWTTRPLTVDDASAVADLMRRDEIEAAGESTIVEADLVADWGQPGFDMVANTLGFFDGQRLIAYSEYTGGARFDGCVDPAYRGRGLGTQVARFAADRARDCGAGIVGTPVVKGSAGDRLLDALGYHIRWESWILVLPADTPAPDPDVHGVRIVAAHDEADRREAWRVLEDAFLEWAGRARETFEEFEAATVRRPGHEQWLIQVARDASDEVVGAAVLTLDDGIGYIARLGVDRSHRGHGIATALLGTAFGLLRHHGATRCELSTDSRTGALDLYVKLGMEVASTWVQRALLLGAADEDAAETASSPGPGEAEGS